MGIPPQVCGNWCVGMRIGRSSLVQSLLGKREKVEILTVRIEREAGSSFGLFLNEHNRITRIDPDTPAAVGGLKPFDRITKADGLPLDVKICDFAAVKEALLLTIERPPSTMHAAIADHENVENSLPFSLEPQNAPVPPVAPDRPEMASGLELLTVVLSREDGGQFGLEVSMDNVILNVDVDSAAHCAGLRTGDNVIKVDGKVLDEPLPQMLPKLLYGHNLVLSVTRGCRYSRTMSQSVQELSAEL